MRISALDSGELGEHPRTCRQTVDVAKEAPVDQEGMQGDQPPRCIILQGLVRPGLVQIEDPYPLLFPDVLMVELTQFL
jgi:hypothetical protein